MASPNLILAAFRQELIAAELVRAPSEAGTRPPCHIEPRDGAPAPGEREAPEDHPTLVLSLFHSGDLGETNYDAVARRRAIIDVRYRAVDNAALRAAMDLDAAIRGHLIRPETHYGYGFNLGDETPIFCHQASVWGGFGPISRGRGVAFDNVAKYMVEARP